MLIVCVIVTCIAMGAVIASVLRISKFNRIEKEITKYMAILIVANILGFASLCGMCYIRDSFVLFDYLGICTYCMFVEVAMFAFLKLFIFSNHSKELLLKELVVRVVIKFVTISVLTILWIVANVFLENSIYITFSFPGLMFICIIVIFVRFLNKRMKIQM